MVTLYSTGCFNCKRLIERLNSNNICYTISNDIEHIKSLGFTTVPILQIDEKYLTYKEAVNWIKEKQNV